MEQRRVIELCKVPLFCAVCVNGIQSIVVRILQFVWLVAAICLLSARHDTVQKGNAVVFQYRNRDSKSCSRAQQLSALYSLGLSEGIISERRNSCMIRMAHRWSTKWQRKEKWSLSTINYDKVKKKKLQKCTCCLCLRGRLLHFGLDSENVRVWVWVARLLSFLVLDPCTSSLMIRTEMQNSQQIRRLWIVRGVTGGSGGSRSQSIIGFILTISRCLRSRDNITWKLKH